MKRHEILGKTLRIPREKCLKILRAYEMEFAADTAPGQPQQQFGREQQIGDAVAYAVLDDRYLRN